MMKYAVSALFLVVGMSSATACPRTRDRWLCPGDAVFQTSSPQKGRAVVRAVNVYQGTALVAFDNVYYGNLSLNATQVSVAEGCLGASCVGDRVMQTSSPQKGYARVVALNPHQRSVTIAFDNVYYGNLTIDARALSVLRGCLAGNCVGDRVYQSSQPNKGSARIVAIDFWSRQLVVAFDNVYYGNLAIDPRGVSSTEYCLDYTEAQRWRDAYLPRPDRSRGMRPVPGFDDYYGPY